MEKDNALEKIKEHFRVPEEVSNKLQHGAEKVRGGYLLFETRPRWDAPDAPWTKSPVAKIIYHNLSNRWKLYWMRASGKWNRYPTKAKTFDGVLGVIEKDEYGCFWG